MCLLAHLGVNCSIEVVANRFPWTGTVGQRVSKEVRTGEIGGVAPTSEIDLFLIIHNLLVLQSSGLIHGFQCRIPSSHLPGVGRFRAI